jgi:hypothetical protein
MFVKNRRNLKSIYYHRWFSIINFGDPGNFGNCKDQFKNIKRVRFDSETRSVYFLKFARPHEFLEVKH